MRGNTLLSALLASALCAACNDAGTSTGNPAPDDPDSGPPRETDNDSGGELGAIGYCRAGEATEFALDEDSPLGFSPSDILAFASGSHEDVIRWNMQTNVAYGPESGEGSIAITITPKGTARHVEPAPPGAGEGGPAPLIDIDTQCTSWVEIDVEVLVETEGGALDERFEAVLRAHTPLMTSLFTSFKAEGLQGSLEAHGTGPLDGFVLGGAQLNVRLSPFGMSGTFHGWLAGPDSGGDTPAVGGGPPFATIGVAACAGDGFPVGANDAIEGATVQDALDMIADSAELSITWENGSTTDASAGFTPSGGGGCALLDNEQPGDLTLVIDGALALESADERLDGEWPGRMEAHVGDDGAISRIVFHVADYLMSNVQLGGAYYGFPDIDLSMFDAAGTSLDLTITSTGIEGTITLIAYEYAECERPAPDEPEGEGGGMSTPGCAGASPTELATGVFQ